MEDTLPEPGKGKIALSELSGARFQILWTIALSSLLHTSMGPSILILKEVRITAKRVAVNVTVPSAFKGMFIATKR